MQRMTNEFSLYLTSREPLEDKLTEHGFTDFTNKGIVLDMNADQLWRYLVHCGNQEDMNYCKLIFSGDL